MGFSNALNLLLAAPFTFLLFCCNLSIESADSKRESLYIACEVGYNKTNKETKYDKAWNYCHDYVDRIYKY